MSRGALAVLVALAIAGCKEKKASIPDAGAGPYGIEDMVVGEPGHQVSLGASLSLPSGWPADVPLYPGAHVSSVQVGDGGDGTTILFETRDAPTAVEAFYRGRFATMPVQLDLGMMGARTLVVRSPTHTVSLFVTRVYGDTRVTLAVVPA